MKWFLAALGLLMVAAGGYWAFTGSLIVQVERGWSAVIAGSVVFSTGFLILALSALMGSVDRLAKAMRDVQGAAPRPVAARPQVASKVTAASAPAPAVPEETDDTSQLKLELVSAPAPIAAVFTPMAAAVTVVATPSPPVASAAEPNVEPGSLPQAENSPIPVRNAEPPARPVPATAPPQANKATQTAPVRPMTPRPAPPTPAGRPVPPPPPAARVRPIHPGLAPPPPPDATPVAEAQPPTGSSIAADQPPIPAPRPIEPRKGGWLERALAEKSPEEVAALASAAASVAPTPPASSSVEAPAKLAERGEKETPHASALTSHETPDLNVARNDAAAVADRTQAPIAESPKPDDPSVEPQPRPDLRPPLEPVPLPVARPDELDQATPTRPIPEPPPIADLPKIMRKYESQGVSYTLYEDGSIDADSSAGRFRFASLDELRAFLEPKS